MLLLTLPRITTLSLTFACLKEYGFIAIAVLMSMSLISIFRYYKGDVKNAILGTISSIVAPCITLDEFSNFYLIVGISSSIGFTMMFASNFVIDFLLTGTYEPEIFSNVPFKITFLTCLGICWILSMPATWALHLYLDASSQLGQCLSQWTQEEDSLWLPFVEKISCWCHSLPKCLSCCNCGCKKPHVLNEDQFQELDREAKEKMGYSLLEFSVSTEKFHMTKVNNLLVNAHLELYQV